MSVFSGGTSDTYPANFKGFPDIGSGAGTAGSSNGVLPVLAGTQTSNGTPFQTGPAQTSGFQFPQTAQYPTNFQYPQGLPQQPTMDSGYQSFTNNGFANAGASNNYVPPSGTGTPAPNPLAGPTGTPSGPAGGTGSSAPGGAAYQAQLTPPPANTPYSQLNPALAGYSSTPGAASPAGYYQQPLSDVISGTGYNTAPTFSTYLASKVAGVKSESPGAIAGDIAASAGPNAGPNGQEPAGWANWTPAAQWAWDYATTHPDAPEVQQAGSLQAFAGAYNDPSKYSYQALTGYSLPQVQNAPAGTTYGNSNNYGTVNSPLAGGTGYIPPQSTQAPQQQPQAQTTQPNVYQPAQNLNSSGSILTDLYNLLSGGNKQGSTVGTTPLGYTQYQQPNFAGMSQQQLMNYILAGNGGLNTSLQASNQYNQNQGSTTNNSLSPQMLVALLSTLSGQNQNTQQVPYWYL